MERIEHHCSELPGVRFIDAEYHRFVFPRHFHLDYHIGLMLDGRQRYVHGGERCLAGGGDILLMTPESIHDGASEGDGGYRIRVLSVEPQWLEQAARAFSDGRQGTPRLLASQLRDAGLHQQLHGLHQVLMGGERLEQEGLLWQGLARLLEHTTSLRIREPAQGFDRATWSRLRDWLESRLETPPTLDELADFCNLSQWQVLRRFRNHCGLPPHQWLTQLRLERALPRVIAGQPLSEIALSLGFYDQAHFSRLFRRTYGLPPARLRPR